MNFLDYLHTPFPRPRRSKKNLLWVILVGLSASLFILLYNPFGIRNDTRVWYADLIIFSLGILFILSVLIMEWGVPAVFPKLFQKWTFGKAIVWYAMVILFIGANQFLYKSFWGGFSEFTLIDFLKVLGRTLGISFAVSFFVLGIWQYINRRKLSQLSSGENYLLKSQDGKELRLNLKDILYIRSDDNYVDIHYESEGVRKKIVFRSSLKNLEAQLVNPISPIYRCHRQYLVNVNYFQILKWGSRNMAISLKNYEDEVPVSKTYSDAIHRQLHTRP